MATAAKAAARRNKDQARAAELKLRKEERRQARCPICYRLVVADMLKEGMSRHRCGN